MKRASKSKSLFDPKIAFARPPSDENGLVAIGGNLEPETLLTAYQAGVFPWYDEGVPICWWSPDPRAIIEIDGLHISRSLQRTIRSGRFESSINRDFSQVMRGCARRVEGSWITEDMLSAYQLLHELGHAHSLEIWHEEKLVGGVYGVAIGSFFAGESMFHRETDASKVALVALVNRLAECGFSLFDIQFITPHTCRMGATEISRAIYLERLQAALARKADFADS